MHFSGVSKAALRSKGKDLRIKGYSTMGREELSGKLWLLLRADFIYANYYKQSGKLTAPQERRVRKALNRAKKVERKS